MNSKNKNLRALTEGAAMVAAAVVLNFLKVDLFAQGGSINLIFIPLMVYALRWGAGWGVAAGAVFGVLKAIIGGGISYGWQSLLLDYAVAYALVGLAGLMPKKPVLSTVFGTLGALLSFVLSGVIVWGEWMPEAFLGLKMVNIWVYSFLYNGLYTVTNGVLAALVIALLSKRRDLLERQN